MVILLKNRAAIYQREAAEMLHNISLYPGLTEEQLCRFFPEKEATAKTLLAHMLKEGRIFCSGNDRYYANREVQGNAVKDLSRCVWVLLDFIDQVEYHTVGEFPAAILCFANGELYEIVPIPQGKETMICQLLRQPQKDAGKRIVVVDDAAQIELLNIPQVAGLQVYLSLCRWRQWARSVFHSSRRLPALPCSTALCGGPASDWWTQCCVRRPARPPTEPQTNPA